jgi:hypothetical protein
MDNRNLKVSSYNKMTFDYVIGKTMDEVRCGGEILKTNKANRRLEMYFPS